MKRRDFLKAGVAGAVGATAQSAQASAAPPLDPAAMEGKLEKLDRRMAWFSQSDLVPREPRTDVEAALFARRRELTRRACRTFYFTGAFLDLPETDQMHPGVQERVGRMQPEMDRTVADMADLLDDLSSEERKAIQKELKDQPQLGGQIGEAFHRIAVEDGFGLAPRLDMRLAFADLTLRLKAQNPSLLIDPCLNKVRKLQALAAEDVTGEREATAKLSAETFWALEQRLGGHVRDWDRIYAVRPRADRDRLEAVYPAGGTLLAQAVEPPLSAPPPPPPIGPLVPEPAAPGAAAEPLPHVDEEEHATELPESRTRRPKQLLTSGGKIMGFGAASLGAGAIFYALAAATGGSAGAGASAFIYPAVVLGITVGPILLAAGLVVIIVAGIWYLAVAP